MRRYEHPLRWVAPPAERAGRARVRYTGRMARDGRELMLHVGHDGWKSPKDVPLRRVSEGVWEAEVSTRGRLVLDCVIHSVGGSRASTDPARPGASAGFARSGASADAARSGASAGRASSGAAADAARSGVAADADRFGAAAERAPSGAAGCDNNEGADYRLWVGLDPVDAHVHARSPGRDQLGFDSLRIAAYSGGMTHAFVSWQDNDFVEIAAEAVPWLTPLVWVRPGGPDPDDVREKLFDGAAGLKLHPAYDNFPADAVGLDPYLRVAEEAGVPVTVHSAPGPADPDLIARLAERFPTVPIVLYHTYLGPPEGRRRAARHATRLPNLHLETSWCDSATVERLIDDVGPARVLFGSDAATDGPQHFVRNPPNLESGETYNASLLRLAKRLKPAVFRQFLETNARALFGLEA